MSCSHKFHISSRQHHSPETSPAISSSLPIWYWNITTELLQTCLRDAFPCVGLGPGIHQAFLPSTLCFSLPTSFTGHPLPFSGNNQYWLHAQPDSLLARGARRTYHFYLWRTWGLQHDREGNDQQLHQVPGDHTESTCIDTESCMHLLFPRKPSPSLHLGPMGPTSLQELWLQYRNLFIVTKLAKSKSL